MAKKEGLEHLKRDFPIFEIKNKSNVAKEILLADGETVLLQPHGVSKIESVDIIQLPDLRFFRMMSPSMEEMMKYDLFNRTENGLEAASDTSAETDKTRQTVNKPKPAAASGNSGQ